MPAPPGDDAPHEGMAADLGAVDEDGAVNHGKEERVHLRTMVDYGWSRLLALIHRVYFCATHNVHGVLLVLVRVPQGREEVGEEGVVVHETLVESLQPGTLKDRQRCISPIFSRTDFKQNLGVVGPREQPLPGVGEIARVRVVEVRRGQDVDEQVLDEPVLGTVVLLVRVRRPE